MTNIRNIKSIASASVQVKDETGAPTGVFFELAGPTHPKRKAIGFAVARKAQAQYQKSGKLTLDDPVEQQLQAQENMAALTLGWTGFTDDAGQPVPYSTAAALALFSNDDYAWLLEQMQVALNEKERFMQRSVTT